MMTKKLLWNVTAVTGLSLFAVSAWGIGADQPVPSKNQVDLVNRTLPGVKQGPKKTEHALVRSSQLVGSSVKNPEGKSLGTIKDVMIDLTANDVNYVAVAFGGFLGLGDKLFAVPLASLESRLNEDGSHYFVLDIPEESLKNAEGFDANKWPAVASPKWPVAAAPQR